ncbi:hypothetical protein ERHA55_51930 (plasmid) [Erwinia rhapontici]|nr:hypothetical protein ERHA55_51930 [Erwinia rhapontici]
MLPVLGDFMRQYPDIALDLDFTDQLVEVIEEGFDAVIRTGEPADSRLSARHLGYFSALLVASPAYLAEKERLRLLAICSDITACIIVFRIREAGKMAAARGGRPGDPTSMVCNNIETRVCFALRGLGIACLPDFACRHLVADGSLVPILGDFVEWQGRFISCGPPAAMLHRKSVRWLIFLLPECFRHESGAG